MQDESTQWFAARIEQGHRDGDVADTVDPRAFADFLANTLAGLRVTAMNHEAPTLCRIIDTAFGGL